MWARMGDWARFDGFLEWNFHLPTPALRFFNLYYMPYTIYDLVYTIYCVMFNVFYRAHRCLGACPVPLGPPP